MMKVILFYCALICGTFVYAQTNNAGLFYNDNSQTGIQSFDNVASGNYSIALGKGSFARQTGSVALGYENDAFLDGATAVGMENKALGNYSTAIGHLSVASGSSSTAIGSANEASGLNATALGSASIASGDLSVAIGEANEATGERALALGSNTKASGWWATSLGRDTHASAKASTTLGHSTVTNGDYSLASGFGSYANGDFSSALGSVVYANGKFSFAAGRRLTVRGYASAALGVYNLSDTEDDAEEFSYDNTAFVIGNGTSNEDRSNALKVLFDGTTTIAGDLNINSDARLKANIISLGATLSKLLQIDGKTYTMKKDTNHKKKIGLLAQDIEKVFPELVTETNDIKSVNYQGLVPVLINAMKEQQDEIERLKKQDDINDKLQQEIDELKAMVKQFISK
jgi:cell division protein ZapA (FtsZ GTPase activity inhibitor)